MTTPSNVALIRKAFETRLRDWAAAQTPPIPVAWENASFTAPAPSPTNGNGRYVRANLLPGRTISLGLDGLHREYVGVFQTSLVLALLRGSSEAQDLADSLDKTFSAGEPLEQDGFKVWLQQPMSQAGPLIEPDHYVVPVSAPYKAEAYLSP